MVCHHGRPRRWVTLLIPSFDQPTWLPHDLAYYVVERALGLTHGFWGCVARGAVFSGMEVLKGRQAPHDATRSRETLHEMAASQQGREAEVLAHEVQRVCRDLEAMHQQWQALALGMSITLTWDMPSRLRRLTKLKR